MLKRYAIAGAGTRGLCFARAIVDQFGQSASLAALYDTNATRMRGFAEAVGADIPRYHDFDRMVAERRPDVLIICTPDHTHDDMIELAFRHGMDAICEKPMATTLDKVRRIFELERECRRRVRVTFNVRYSTFAERLKQVVAENNIGPVRNVHLEWFLDQVHGAEYFRRWHRHLDLSGGLLVHKATHHFDYVNWLINDAPTRVSAFGALRFYGHNGPFRGDSCRTCEHAPECRFRMDTSATDDPSIGRLRSMFLDAEHEDGYLRDRCVFGRDIDIYDTMSVLATYRGGAQLSYALNAYAPCEGYRMTLTGTDGRIEAEEYFGGIMQHGGRPTNPIRVIRGRTRRDITIEQFDVPMDRSDHGGGDDRLYRHLFEPNTPDPLGQCAGSEDGANSCLLGICANESIETGDMVNVPDVRQWRQAFECVSV